MSWGEEKDGTEEGFFVTKTFTLRKGDPKTEKGPLGDLVPQKGNHLGTVFWILKFLSYLCKWCLLRLVVKIAFQGRRKNKSAKIYYN